MIYDEENYDLENYEQEILCEESLFFWQEYGENEDWEWEIRDAFRDGRGEENR